MNLLRALESIASEAGKVIMDIYSPTLKVDAKTNSSPVTEADAAAERVIKTRLQEIIPGFLWWRRKSSTRQEQRLRAPAVFLVDPLDGTREFIAGSDEFTVNIALVEAGQAGRRLRLCAGAESDVSRRGRSLPRGCPAGRRAARARDDAEARDRALSARRVARDGEPFASRCRNRGALKKLKVGTWKSAGSSLKFCMIAQGEGDIYPRLAPTMEWDTAAGQAVLTAAGGCVIGRDGSPFRYGKSGFRNDGFVAWGREPLP